MRIGIVGTGIAGLTAACLLHRRHDVVLFESEGRLGGHAHTVTVTEGAREIPVDTGFIVYNDSTYPNFRKLLDRYRVATQPSDMSFSVQVKATGLEYASRGLRGFFADRSRLVDPKLWSLFSNIFRFNGEALRFLEQGENSVTLGEFLESRRFPKEFLAHYVVPLVSAIWSAGPGEISSYPAGYFLNFFRNHGLLDVMKGPQWRVITGGSHAYVEAFSSGYKDAVRLNAPVSGIRREAERVLVRWQGGEPECFDQVILAVHSDTALSMLEDATEREREILSSMAYRDNDVVLHTDTRVMPRNTRAWASWNYYIPDGPNDRPTLTYDMNRLQSLTTSERYLVTLNRSSGIDPQRVRGRYQYAHPVYTARSIANQARHSEISGQHRTHFCGAYWGYGFHEDGVKSALKVAQWFGQGIADV